MCSKCRFCQLFSVSQSVKPDNGIIHFRKRKNIIELQISLSVITNANYLYVIQENRRLIRYILHLFNQRKGKHFKLKVEQVHLTDVCQGNEMCEI